MVTRIVGVVGAVILLGYMSIDVWREQQRSEAEKANTPAVVKTEAADEADNTAPMPTSTPAVETDAKPQDVVQVDEPTASSEAISAPSNVTEGQSTASAESTAATMEAEKETNPEAVEAPSTVPTEQLQAEPPSIQDTTTKPDAAASASVTETTDTQLAEEVVAKEAAAPSAPADVPETPAIETAIEPPPPAPAQVPAKPRTIDVDLMITTADASQVRVAPNPNSDAVGAVGSGTILRATRVGNSKWYFVQDLNYTISGYVTASQLSKLNK